MRRRSPPRPSDAALFVKERSVIPVEFIGFIANHNASEIIPRNGPVIDRDYIETVSTAMNMRGSTARCSPSTPMRPIACKLGNKRRA
jgi:hypothetical protein